jgi:hypothetical protein
MGPLAVISRPLGWKLVVIVGLVAELSILCEEECRTLPLPTGLPEVRKPGGQGTYRASGGILYSSGIGGIWGGRDVTFLGVVLPYNNILSPKLKRKKILEH